MAKIEKINLALDSESKRLLRNLTKALEKVARSMTPYEVKGGTRRLSEPHEPGREDPLEPGDTTYSRYIAGIIPDEELKEMKRTRPEMFETEPALRYVEV